MIFFFSSFDIPNSHPNLYHRVFWPIISLAISLLLVLAETLQLALWALKDLAMKLSSSFPNPNAVLNLITSFPNLSINPDNSSSLPISSSAESCSSFSTGCTLGHISYTLCSCIQWLRMLISAFHVLPTVCTLSHDFQSGCVLSHWLLYLASMYLFCALMAVTVLIFPLDSSCAVDICMCFPRVRDISLDIFLLQTEITCPKKKKKAVSD